LFATDAYGGIEFCQMAALNLSIPDRLKTTAEAKAAAGGFKSVDEYVASLIEADELPPIEGRLESDLLEGLDSGPSVPLTAEFLADVKRRARA